MRIARHVVTQDTGLAPNPFHGFCTSALCTPSHMDASLQQGGGMRQTVTPNH